jgi:hypothetical protein
MVVVATRPDFRSSPSELLSVVRKELSAVRLPRSRIHDLQHLLYALLDGDGDAFEVVRAGGLESHFCGDEPGMDGECDDVVRGVVLVHSADYEVEHCLGAACRAEVEPKKVYIYNDSRR